MLLEPRPNRDDLGYPYNPEAAAWLANYYSQWEANYGGGGGGGGWDSHASTSGILGYRWEGDNRIDNATGKIVGVRQNGHYEKVITQNNGTIHGNRLNNETDPNLIDEVSVEYKWVWDVPILSQSGFGDFSSRFSIDFQGDSKLTIGVQAGGNVGGFGGQYGIFGNLCSVTLIGNEGKKLIYPTSQQSGFSQINQGLSGGLIVGAGISHTFNGSFEGYGYANDSYLYLGWLSNKKGIFGITYSHSAEGNTINIGINLQIALILGFEGSYNLRIKW